MRRLPGFAVMLFAACVAEGPENIDWQLLAINGVVTPPSFSVTFGIDPDGRVSGETPCNSYEATNTVALLGFRLDAFRTTYSACDPLREERQFFDTLPKIDQIARDGQQNLIMTGPGGTSLEFVRDRMNSLLVCKTCQP